MRAWRAIVTTFFLLENSVHISSLPRTKVGVKGNEATCCNRRIYEDMGWSTRPSSTRAQVQNFTTAARPAASIAPFWLLYLLQLSLTLPSRQRPLCTCVWNNIHVARTILINEYRQGRMKAEIRLHHIRVHQTEQQNMYLCWTPSTVKNTVTNSPSFAN